MGPGDLIYTPLGYVTTHRVIGNTNLLGLRIGVLSKCDVDILKVMKDSHAKSGKTSDIIEQALEFLGAAVAVAEPAAA